MIQFFTGLLMAAVHVVTGPDHLAAVTPLAIENRRKAWHVGLFWGIGHVTGMLLIGLLYLAFRQVIPVESISGYSEFLVGFVLIAIGAWAIVRIFAKKHTHHAHPHAHSGPEPYVHIHAHHHSDELVHVHSHTKATRQNNITSLLVGTLHGFAGISHFLLILPTLALPGLADSVTYLSGFAAGTIGAMVAYALVLGLVSKHTENISKGQLLKFIRIFAGLLAIGVGIWWILQ